MPTPEKPYDDTALRAINRRFYDALWSDAQLVDPQRFNTWPLVCELAADASCRLEVAPGLRPRLPLDETFFVDLSAPAVSRLRARGAAAVRGLVTSIPYADRAFDFVCAFDIVEHVDNDEGAFAELARVAAPKAALLLSVPLHPAQWTAFDDFVGHRRRYAPAALSAQLARHGFAVERSAVYGMQPKSSKLLELGMWFLTHRRERAMWWYNRVFMPLGLRRQQPLKFVAGMIEDQGVDEILLVCRKLDSAAISP